ncbi:MAG: tetratricopeptide repeat protein [bacterium]
MKLKAAFFFLGWLWLGAGSAFAETAADYYKEATLFYGQKDYDHAFDAYQGAANLDPNPYRAFAGMGNCEYARGHKTKAIQDYRLSLKLYPNNPPLAQFVERLRDELDSKGGPFYKGRMAFHEKRYKDADKDFQEAVEDDPENLPAFYYQAYCDYLTEDRAYAALNFAYYGKKKKDLKVQVLADRIKFGLSLEDQDWVDTQLKTEPPFPPPFQYSGIGLRLDTDIQFVGLKDFSNYAKSLQKTNPQVTADAPAVALAADVNPFIQLTDGVEAGLRFGGIFLGNFTASTSDTAPQQNGTFGFDVWNFGLNLKARVLKLDRGRIRIFAEADPGAYFANLSVVNSDTLSGWGFIPANGNFSSMGFGGLFKLGVEWKPLPNSLVGFFAGYQLANLTGFTGSAAANGSAASVPGKLETVENGSNTDIEFVPDGVTPTVPSGSSLHPLSMDLSGLLLGAQLTALF